MDRNVIKNEYFEWLLNLVCADIYSKNISYRKLLTYLHTVEFKFIMPRDENRYNDGISLRYRFAQAREYEDYEVSYIDEPCSVLEMMIALAFKAEEVMDDPAYGDRTLQWFWGMISSLGLGDMVDSRFDKMYVKNVIDRFLNRDYKRNGKGGLFTIKNNDRDLRDTEIWIQMCLYLDNLIGL